MEYRNAPLSGKFLRITDELMMRAMICMSEVEWVIYIYISYLYLFCKESFDLLLLN